MSELKKLSDKELRQLARTMMKEMRLVREAIKYVRKQYWKKKYELEKQQAERKTVLVERGIRKGKECPALEQTSYHFKCTARKCWTYGRDIPDIYAKYCGSCRLTHDEARTKAALNKIGVT